MSIQETLLKIKGEQRILRIAGESLILVLVVSGLFYVGHVLALKPTRDVAKTLEHKASEPIHLDIPTNPDSGSDVGEKVAGNKPAPKSGSTASANPSSAPAKTTSWTFAASKSGKVYYPKDCKALSRVKPENRVTFRTEAEAVAKGLTRSKSCS